MPRSAFALHSPMFDTLLKSTGPKMVTVSREKAADYSCKLDGCVVVGRSRDSDTGDDYIHLPDDHKVSREHCRFDAGPLAVCVTDMGSSKGTRLDSKDGKKIMTKVRRRRMGGCPMGLPFDVEGVSLAFGAPPCAPPATRASILRPCHPSLHMRLPPSLYPSLSLGRSSCPASPSTSVATCLRTSWGRRRPKRRRASSAACLAARRSEPDQQCLGSLLLRTI